MDIRPPGFSCNTQLSKPHAPEPLFPRWLTRLVCAYIAAHTIIGLAVLIAATLAIVHFLPLIQKLPLLIQRISELTGV